jgi:hypothetical protein
MVSLEQVKLLDAKVSKAIDYIASLSQENAALRGKLDGYRRRIDELEVLVRAFKDDQGRIEESINAALDRLSQFEAAVESGLEEPVTAPSPAPSSPAPGSVETGGSTAAPEADGSESTGGQPSDSFEAAFAAELAAETAAAEAAAAAVESDEPEAGKTGSDESSVTPAPAAEGGAELDIF